MPQFPRRPVPNDTTPDVVSDRFETAFWATNLIGASWQPWMLAGMGLILFAIGRFFSTIVGFVVARRVIITEGTDAISTAIATGSMEPEEAEPDRQP